VVSATVTFFLDEANDCLEALRRELSRESADPAALYFAARRLRGSAQMARLGALADTAWDLEGRLRTVARGPGSWTPTVRQDVQTGFQTLVHRVDRVRTRGMEHMTESMMVDERRAAGEIVPIETIEYDRRAALRRALALREPLEQALVSGESPSPILDELFDLIRLAAK
jgi:chemotaxis protein histidine kinase CheA